MSEPQRAKQPDGTFLASQINVFSEDQRGTGEGHRPLGNATMTNANVERVEDVMVRDVKGRMLKLKYKDGEVNVLVPPDIPLTNEWCQTAASSKPAQKYRSLWLQRPMVRSRRDRSPCACRSPKLQS